MDSETGRPKVKADYMTRLRNPRDLLLLLAVVAGEAFSAWEVAGITGVWLWLFGLTSAVVIFTAYQLWRSE